MARARVSTHKGSVEEAMGHTSVNIHTDTLNDLEENTIYGKLHKAAGMHRHLQLFFFFVFVMDWRNLPPIA